MPPRPTTEQFSPPAYAYDVLDRSTERQSAQQEREPITDHFGYNHRSELTSATLDGTPYAYTYDNIGKTADGCKAGWTCAQHAPRRGEATRGCRRINRRLAFGGADYAVYATNDLNQYTQIDTNGSDFTPEYDADGNQTLVKTATGIWHVTYNAQNRAIRYESEDGTTVITCGYDYMGRRFEKKVEVNGETTLHEGYIYHGYLQIACVDLQKPFQAAKRYISWDPTQSTATRPLALQQNSVWYTYGWDLTKNICELYNNTGYILNLYTYTPYGAVSAEGDVDQPIQWSSEMHDAELGLVYYNYRYYNPVDGRWTRRDPIGIKGGVNLYMYACNNAVMITDLLGLLRSASEYINMYGNFGESGMSYCHALGKFLNDLAHDDAATSLSTFVHLLGDPNDGSSLANAVAHGLGKKLNIQIKISTKLYQTPVEEDAEMYILTEENLRRVGFKRSLVANGKDNMRHFTAIMKYGTLAYLYLTATDAGEALLWSEGARNEENHAEFEADARAYSIYIYLNLLNMSKDWKCFRDKIQTLWNTYFCN